MGGDAAPLGDDAYHAVVVHLGGHGWGQVVHHQDAVLGQVFQIQLFHAQQDFQQLLLNVLHIGDPLLDQLHLGALEQGLEHLQHRFRRRFRAHALVDAVPHLLLQERVLYHVDVAG